MVARALNGVARDGTALVTAGTLYGAAQPVIANADTQTYEPGLEPVANTDGSWTYTLPARGDFTNLPKRRLERVWQVDGRVCTHTRGDVVVFDAEFAGVLGAAAQSANQWHLLWQCHGPGGSDLVAWRPPPISLGVTNGVISFEGGEGHPSNQYTSTGYYKWSYPLGPWVDNVRHHIRIEIKLGNDPDGWVTCRYDGATIVEQWRPQGYWPFNGGNWTGKYPGTMFSTPGDVNGDWVQNRAGLYRGPAHGDPSPTYQQWMRWWPMAVSPAHLGAS